MWPLLFTTLFILLSVLMCWQESKRKIMPLWLGLLLCFIITPIGVYLLYLFLPLKNPKGCLHCGNKENEAEYCGLCSKNDLGELYNG